jgi:hypothetical protein
MAAALGAAVLVVPAAARAGWTRPVPVVEGDDAGLVGATIRPDGGLRAGVYDKPHGLGFGFVDSPDGAALGTPIATLAAGPTYVGDVGFAADGSGLAATYVPRTKVTDIMAFGSDGVLAPASLLHATGGWTDLAVAPSGAAVVAWVRKGAHGAEVDAAFREPGAAAFGPVQRAGYVESADAIVHAGIGDRGEAVVTWQVNQFPSRLAAAVRQPGAGFGRARFIAPAASDTHLAVGPGGQAIVTVVHGRRLDVSVKAAGAARMPVARTVDRAAGDAYGGDAAAAAGSSTVAAAWTAAGASRKAGRAQVRVLVGSARSGRVRRVGTVGRDAGGDAVALAVSGSGAAMVGWQEELHAKRGDPTARAHLGVAVRVAGGRFGAPTWMGPVSLDDTPLLALLSGSRGYVAYEAFQSGDAGGEGYRRVYVAGWRR